jgi:two-component system, NtrC family, response regulator AtoC
MLMEHFLNLFNNRFNKKVIGFSNEAKQVLLDYPFPGNVRELRNVVEYAINVCRGNRILPESLPEYILEFDCDAVENDRVHENGVPPVASGPVTDSTAVTWSEMEQKMIMDAMVKARGRRTAAAEILGWGRATLWRKMKLYGMV